MRRGIRQLRSSLAAAAVVGFLGGCALETPPPTTGYLPPDAFAHVVSGDQDTAFIATNEATWAFTHIDAMQGRPAQMALAVASLDAIAGQFSTRGRWMSMNSLAKLDMLDARSAVRRVLGIAAGTPSQTVIDSMMSVYHALGHGDRKAALVAVSEPAFTYPPARTLHILAHFPHVPVAAHATRFASAYLLGGSGGWSMPFRQ